MSRQVSKGAGWSASLLAFAHVRMIAFPLEVPMNAITITLSDDRLAQLQEMAARLRVSPEEERRTLSAVGVVRYLALNEVLALHGQVMAQSGGAMGILNLPALESALAQPRMTFGGDDLYPTL